MSRVRFVPMLEDLIQPEDYAGDPEGRRVVLRIRCTEGGVEMSGDAARATVLDALLRELEAEEIEQMLCG